MIRKYKDMNQEIFLKLYSLAHQSGILDWLIIFCAKYLSYLAVLFLLFYIFYHHIGEFDWQKPFDIIGKRIKELKTAFFSPVIIWIIVAILKEIFNSPRPFILFNDKVVPLFTHGGMDSFPSGHAAFFGAMAISVFFVNKKLGFIYVIIALLIGIARIASGIHFPIDILAGYILGIILSLIFNLLFKIKNRR